MNEGRWRWDVYYCKKEETKKKRYGWEKEEKYNVEERQNVEEKQNDVGEKELQRKRLENHILII